MDSRAEDPQIAEDEKDIELVKDHIIKLLKNRLRIMIGKV